MLNKELNQLSGMSKSGNQVSEYISTTFLGKLTLKLFYQALALSFMSVLSNLFASAAHLHRSENFFVFTRF